MKLGLIDLGIGNLGSIESAMTKLNVQYNICKSSNDLKGIDKIILPGVGSYKAFMETLKNKDLQKALTNLSYEDHPILGICLGFQILFTTSSELGITNGLDLVKGNIINFKEFDKKIKIPHVGWNSCTFKKDSKLFSGIKTESDFYFSHSFYLSDFEDGIIEAETFYNLKFISAIRKKNIYGVQFHPEKSQSNGLKLIKNFVENC